MTNENVEKVQSWLSYIGDHFDLDLQLNSEGFAVLHPNSGEELVISLDAHGRFLRLLAYLTESVGEIPEVEFRNLLSLNYDDNLLKGCTIGYSKECDRVTLGAFMPIANLDEVSCLNFLKNFYSVMVYLSEQVLKPKLDNPQEAQEEVTIDKTYNSSNSQQIWG